VRHSPAFHDAEAARRGLPFLLLPGLDPVGAHHDVAQWVRAMHPSQRPTFVPGGPALEDSASWIRLQPGDDADTQLTVSTIQASGASPVPRGPAGDDVIAEEVLRRLVERAAAAPPAPAGREPLLGPDPFGLLLVPAARAFLVGLDQSRIPLAGLGSFFSRLDLLRPAPRAVDLHPDALRHDTTVVRTDRSGWRFRRHVGAFHAVGGGELPPVLRESYRTVTGLEQAGLPDDVAALVVVNGRPRTYLGEQITLARLERPAGQAPDVAAMSLAVGGSLAERLGLVVPWTDRYFTRWWAT
jgi:hypothetical protein